MGEVEENAALLLSILIMSLSGGKETVLEVTFKLVQEKKGGGGKEKIVCVMNYPGLSLCHELPRA